MKQIGLKQIRNRRLPRARFRLGVNELSLVLAQATFAKISKPKRGRVVLVLILRSSVAMLPAFLKFFPTAPIGFLGYKRDDRTAIAKKYYENLPKLNKNSIVIIPDPMLATGGTLAQALKILRTQGVRPANIYYTGFIGAEAGFRRIAEILPAKHITLLAVDPKLDRKKFIVPGLGDFGDRYFGV